MPIQCDGTSGQLEAVQRGLKVVQSDGIKYQYFIDDLTKSCQNYIDTIGEANLKCWTIGQLASIVRTPQLYFRAAYLQQLE